MDSLLDDDRAHLAPLRASLEERAAGGRTLTYAQAVDVLRLQGPHTIHRVALMLEELIAEDAAAGRPLLASLVISRAGPLPKPGFFVCAAKHGVYDGAEDGAEAAAFHAAQLEALRRSV